MHQAVTCGLTFFNPPPQSANGLFETKVKTLNQITEGTMNRVKAASAGKPLQSCEMAIFLKVRYGNDETKRPDPVIRVRDATDASFLLSIRPNDDALSVRCCRCWRRYRRRWWRRWRSA